MFAEMRWCVARDADPRGLAIFRRHYSSVLAAQKAPAGPRRFKWFVGPGERVVLLTSDCRAMFTWRKQGHRADGQTGICCTVFRNEGGDRSSDLIREADAYADARWPGERHFTFVDPTSIRSTNPGFCFLCAGWQRAGHSKRGLVILERLP